MSSVHRIQSYLAFFEPAEEGGYNVSFPDFPGCVTFGYTFEEAQAKAKEVLQLWIEELRVERKPLPHRDKQQRPVISEIQVAV